MPRSQKGGISLLSYNIHGCIGTDRSYNAERIISVLRQADADVVALQEVYDEIPADRQFLKSLQTLPYPHFVYGRTLKHESRGDYGNLLLSKWPLNDIQHIDLSVPNTEPRGAIRASIKLPKRTLDLTTAHLGLSRKERVTQVATLLQHWGESIINIAQGHAFVFMGDLNEWIPQSRLIDSLARAIGQSESQPTFPSLHPTFALDHIFVRPSRTIANRQVIDNALTRAASDHLPLLAKLQPRSPVI